MKAQTIVLLALVLGCGSSPSAGGPPEKKAAADKPTAPATPAAAPAPPAAPTPAPQPAPTADAPTPDPDRLMAPKTMEGFWHASPDLAGGYSEVLLLFKDGRFKFHGAQGGCTRLKERAGTWKLDGAALVLSEESRDEITGGKEVNDEIDCSIKGGKEKKTTNPAPVAETLKLEDCEPADMEFRDCRRLGGVAYWYWGDDPKVYYEYR
jgi:hypothetical protein